MTINPVAISGLMTAVGAAIAGLTPLLLGRRRGRLDQDATYLQGYVALNTGLRQEVERLHGELAEARATIDGLEAENAALRQQAAGRPGT